MNLEEQAQTWVRWSKDNLPEAGDIPMIGETGFVCPWRTDIEAIAREYCSQFDDAPQECPEPWASYFVRILNAEPEDVAARFTFLDLYQAMIDTGILPDDNYCQLERAEDELQLLIDALPVEDCPAKWRNVSWEISNAAVVRDWQRAFDLFRRAEDLRLLERVDLQILRGTFIFAHVFGWFRPVDGSRLSLHLDRGNEGFESSWFWCDHQQFFDVHDHRVITDSQTEMLRIAVMDLNCALAERPEISPVYRAMLAHCRFSLGQYRDAAYHYEQCLACDLPPHLAWMVLGGEPDRRIMQTIAKCYQLAGDVGEAKLFLEKCLAKYPSRPGLHLQMADLCAQEADYRSAYACARKEVEINPKAEADLGIRLALALGEIPPSEQDSVGAVEKYLVSNPVVTERLESVIKLHWPTFGILSDMARDSWGRGAFMMLLPLADPKAKQDFKRSAAAKFALAVEIEVAFGNFFWPISAV